MNEAEAIGFVDSILMLEAIYERRQDQARFEAALHGRELRN